MSIPALQTKVGKHITNNVNNDFKTDINIEKVGFHLNGDIELKHVLIKDHKKDTLIFIKSLNSSIISIKNLYNNTLNFGAIDIKDLVFHLKTYKDENITNLDVFVNSFESNSPKVAKNKFLFSSSDISIDNGLFSVVNENLEFPEVLHFSNLKANTTNFVINGPDVKTRINTLSFTDKRGVKVKQLSTNFQYTLEAMHFDNLNLLTEGSQLNGNLSFYYKREDLKFFTEKVNIDATFKNSEIALTELNAFFDEFGTGQRANLNTQLLGTLNNLKAKNLRVTTSTNTKIIGDINFKNLFSETKHSFSLDGSFKQLSSNYKDLVDLLPNILGKSIPSIFDNLGNFKLSGTSFVKANQMQSKFNINTALGEAKADLEIINADTIDNASYVGTLELNDFDLGRLIEDHTLKKTTLNLSLDGKGFTVDKMETFINGTISAVDYNNYVYQNVEASGHLEKKVFNGELKVNDLNLNLDFKGLVDFSEKIKQFDFKADVGYANLHILNFVERDRISEFKGLVSIKAKASNFNDAEGQISIKRTSYKNQDSNYKFKDFEIVSSFQDRQHSISINSPDIITGYISGQFNVTDIFKLTENAMGSIYTNYSPVEVKDGQYFDFKFNIYSKIGTVLFKDLILDKNTFIEGKIEANDNVFELNFEAPEITYKTNYAKAINLEIDNKNPIYNTYIEIDKIESPYYNGSDFSLINVTKRDTLFIKSEFKGGVDNSDNFNVNLFYTINDANAYVAGFKKSKFKFKNIDWVINPAKDTLHKVEFDKHLKTFNIFPAKMTHNTEEIKISGLIEDGNNNLTLNFKDVQLEEITPTIDSLAIKGIVNGNISIEQYNEILLPKSNLEIRDLNINNYTLGVLKSNIVGNNSLTNYNVDISLENKNIKSLQANGFINTKKQNPSINLAVSFNEFLIDPLNPLGEGVISNIRGLLSGSTQVSGNLNRPSINGELFLDKAGLTIPYLNVDYGFDINSKVNLKNQQFLFNNVTLTDSKFQSKANLNGSISHNNFSDWNFDLQLNTNRLLVLNTKETDDSLYYGDAYLNGIANIKGPADQLLINVEGSTAEGTIFNIPLNDSESFGDNSFIHFISPEEKAARQNKTTAQQIEVKGLELDFDLDVNQNAAIEIVIDKDSGSTIKGKGEGLLNFLINTNGKFDMWGSFSVFEGIYNFKYKGLVEKRFEVEPGGSIEWNGNPLGAALNLKAIYKTTANPSVLLDSPITQSIPVEVGIQLTGPLEQPEPNFNFNFPNVTSTVKSELDYRLSAKDERDNQALILLATGSFANGLGNVNISGTIAERLSGIVNNLLGGANDDNFNVGLDFEIGQDTPELQTNNRFGLTLQTKINDKVIVNGKLGVPFGSAQQTTITGDVQIDFLLNEDGSLRAKVFNRENPIRNFGEEIGFTQGLGMSYSVEFDTFRELIRKIVSKQKKQLAKPNNTQAKDTLDTDVMPSYIKMKTNP